MLEFAKLFNVPVSPTLMGWGTLPGDHPLMAGMAGHQTSYCYGNTTMLASDFYLLASDFCFRIGNLWANCFTGSIDVFTQGYKFGYIVLHSLLADNWAGGERGIGRHPNRAAEFKEGVDKTLGYAQVLCTKHINRLSGIVLKEQAEAMFVSNLKYAADKLKNAGILLLIEATSTFEILGFFLTGTKQTLDITTKVSSDNLFF